MGKKIDMTGQRFGRLVVVREVQRQPWEKHTKAMWECRCDCGQVVTVQSSNLRVGNTRSCGCIAREHAIRLGQQKAAAMAGERYGELTVIERAEKPNDGAGKKYPNSSWWRCRCSCGREVVLAGSTSSRHRARTAAASATKSARRRRRSATTEATSTCKTPPAELSCGEKTAPCME